MLVNVKLSIFDIEIIKTVIYKKSAKYNFKLDIKDGNAELNIQHVNNKDIVNEDEVENEIFRDLIDQSLRKTLNEDTKDLRKLIIAQAFSNTDLLDDK